MRASTEGKSRQTSAVTLFVRHQPPASPNTHPSSIHPALLSPAQWDYCDRQMGLGNERHFDGKLRIIPSAARSLIS